MIAGPNGSGKSTLVRQILRPDWIGYYLNPDEMQKSISLIGYFDLTPTGIETSCEEILSFFRHSSFLVSVGMPGNLNEITFGEEKIFFAELVRNSAFPYYVSVLADFIRRKLIERQVSFTFETVMSSFDKVQLLDIAKANGYRTYLYFISTENADINVARVSQRVREQGHSVPEQKIRERYVRSTANLMDAIRLVDRAYIFDNSSEKSQWLVKIADDSSSGKTFIFHADILPVWFKRAVMSKLPKE